MSIPAELTTLVGTWQGTNLLWLSEQPIESEMTAAVKSAAGGTCLCIEYQWNYEGETQEGIILLGSQGPDAVEGIWRDAFHSNASFLISKGKADASNGVQILGSYSAHQDRIGAGEHICKLMGRPLRDYDGEYLS